MKAILITGCSDPDLWYASLVGHTVTYLREYEREYLSYEPAGYTNIVLKSDSELIESENCTPVQ